MVSLAFSSGIHKNVCRPQSQPETWRRMVLPPGNGNERKNQPRISRRGRRPQPNQRFACTACRAEFSVLSCQFSEACVRASGKNPWQEDKDFFTAKTQSHGAHRRNQDAEEPRNADSAGAARSASGLHELLCPAPRGTHRGSKSPCNPPAFFRVPNLCVFSARSAPLRFAFSLVAAMPLQVIRGCSFSFPARGEGS